MSFLFFVHKTKWVEMYLDPSLQSIFTIFKSMLQSGLAVFGPRMSKNKATQNPVKEQK